MTTRDRIRTKGGAIGTMLAAAACALAIALALNWWATPLRSSIASDRFLEDLAFELQFNDYVVLDAKVRLLEEAADAEILGIGDSSCQYGLAPSSMSAASGLSVVNLGTFGTVGTRGHLALLRAALSRGARPRAVILWYHPHTLTSTAEDLSGYAQLEWLQDRIDGAKAAPGPGLALVNDTLGGGLRMAVFDQGRWRRQLFGEAMSPVIVRERMLDTRGWFPTRAQSRPSHYVQDDLAEDSLAGLAALADLCRDSGLEVFLAVMPWVEGASVPAERYQRLVRQVRDAAPAAIWLESMPRETPWSVMQSPTHFGRGEAERVSAELGREIRDRLD